MLDLLHALPASNGFIPHGHCYLWKPELVGLHLLSDLAIGLAYLAISISLINLVSKIRLPFHWVFVAFGLFIAACGATHFMEVWTLWHPNYWTSGLVKLITASASVTTAVLLPALVPQVQALTQTARLAEERRLQLEQANQELATLYEQLKKMDLIKSSFFANVSHELRTPLTLLLGPTERLLKDDQLASSTRRDLEVVSRNARTLLKYVNDLLDVSKLEAGKMNLHLAPVDLAHILRLSASHFQVLAEERQISYIIDTPSSLHALADVEKLQRVFLNLLSNAFKFTPIGGEIRCTLHTFRRIGSQPASTTEQNGSDDHVRVIIQDTGPGVAPELRQAIFERFQQGDRHANQASSGTGLGLAITQEFVELHGGRVFVEDAADGGAQFVVELPLVHGNDEEPKGAESSPLLDPAIAQQALASLRGTLTSDSDTSVSAPDSTWQRQEHLPLVLVVEDTPDMRQFIAETLEADYQVVTAPNGQVGLEKAIALHPDLILADVMMPQMSGDELVQHLRAHPDLDSTPILMLTAKADDELRVALLRDGVQDYLTKPFAVEELRARTANLIAVKQFQDFLEQELAQQSRTAAVLSDTLATRRQELQAALMALRRSEAKFRRVAESNIIGIVFWTVDGTIIEANGTFLQIVGYTPEDIQQGHVNWQYMTPIDYVSLDDQAMAELSSTGKFTPFEKEYVRKDGYRVPVLMGGAFLDDSQEQGVAFVLDITERKQAEAALQRVNDELEMRVAQRTAELSQTNTDLQAQIAERLKVEADLRMSRESIQTLYEVVANPQLDFAGKVKDLLELGCRRFQLPVGIFTRVAGSTVEVLQVNRDETIQQPLIDVLPAIAPGDQLEPEDLYYSWVYVTEPICDHAILLTVDQPLAQSACIAAPILVNGQLYGSLSFVGISSRSIRFTTGDEKFLQLMAQWVGSELTRIQTAEALIQEQEFLKALLDNVNAGIVACDADGVLTLFNQTSRDFHGLPLLPLPAEVWSDDYDLYLPDGKTPMPKTAIPLYRALQGERIQNLEMMIIPKQGQPRTLVASGQAIAAPNGQRLGAVVVMHDITERKQAEAQIRTLNAELERRVLERTAQLETANRQKDELLIREQTARAEAEAANRMKDEFLATLSHELRTPLNAILGWAQLLRTRTFDAATIARALETIERNARSQSQLVGDILDVSRIIRGKLRLNIRPIKLVALAEAALDSVRPAAEAKTIDLQAQYDPDINTITGDADRLQQVIWNLLSNAIKFTPQGGKVSVELSQSENAVHIVVRDTGRGIEPQFLPHVFDRFRQADSSITRSHGGLGLGLAIVRHLVELHGGTVQVHSAGEGQGAMFRVTLPLVAAPQVDIDESSPQRLLAPNTPPKANRVLSGLKIWVVDDEADTREFLNALLEEGGAAVVALSSTQATLDLLTNSPADDLPDLLVSDISMPDQDGYALIQQVRVITGDRGIHLPAVALTGYAGPEDRTRLLLAGFQIHVPKPVDPAELIAVVANLTGRAGAS